MLVGFLFSNSILRLVFFQKNFFHAELIDRVLEEDDLDQDGYLSYIEYVVGRQRDEKERNTPK